MTRLSILGTLALTFVLSIAGTGLAAQARQRGLEKPSDRNIQTPMKLSDEVRHQLLMLPYYGIFDWLEAVVEPDGTVVLSGQVVRPSTKSDAEARVKKLEGVTAVRNQIQTLPPSTFDDQTRLAIYRRLVGELGLEKYFLQAVPPIHIIVQGGHVTLKGIVNSAMDSQLAYTAAAGVPNVFDAKNELRVEKD
jgi:hyperosmotically inducible protein